MTSDKRINALLHVLRNPYGMPESVTRPARLKAADLIEAWVGQIPAYRPEQEHGDAQLNDAALGFDHIIEDVFCREAY